VIYVITNTVNGKRYVGQTTQKEPFDRYFRHLKEARRGSDQLLYRSIRAHSEWAFRFEIIANCDDQRSLNLLEDHYITVFNSLSPNGYNLKRGGANGKASDDLRRRLRVIHGAPETRRRHSEAIARCWDDPDHRDKIKTTWDVKRIIAEPDRMLLEQERREDRARSRPSRIAKRNESIKAAHSNPDVKARIGAGTRGGRWIYRDKKSRRLKCRENMPEGWLFGRGETHGR
jgi:group I intron endonuclease